MKTETITCDFTDKPAPRAHYVTVPYKERQVRAYISLDIGEPYPGTMGEEGQVHWGDVHAARPVAKRIPKRALERGSGRRDRQVGPDHPHRRWPQPRRWPGLAHFPRAVVRRGPGPIHREG